ncbi:hypothetical protein M0R04_14025 [Candidatus Dojkabacteria bacterium]|jgi:hypothetical protein|nr:hypothetical protein [Candidatus Dojkabacteria bacterium]
MIQINKQPNKKWFLRKEGNPHAHYYQVIDDIDEKTLLNLADRIYKKFGKSFPQGDKPI